jgi:uncharacterized protein YqeY
MKFFVAEKMKKSVENVKFLIALGYSKSDAMALCGYFDTDIRQELLEPIERAKEIYKKYLPDEESEDHVHDVVVQIEKED